MEGRHCIPALTVQTLAKVSAKCILNGVTCDLCLFHFHGNCLPLFFSSFFFLDRCSYTASARVARANFSEKTWYRQFFHSQIRQAAYRHKRFPTDSGTSASCLPTHLPARGGCTITSDLCVSVCWWVDGGTGRGWERERPWACLWDCVRECAHFLTLQPVLHKCISVPDCAWSWMDHSCTFVCLCLSLCVCRRVHLSGSHSRVLSKATTCWHFKY